MSRVTISPSPELRKIFCAYHPQQFLTNFCGDAQCLMPLCPNCIVEHTEQHFLQNNKPTYLNLQQALHDTKQKCYQHIVRFQDLNKHNDRIYDYANGIRKSIHEQLAQEKQNLFQFIQELFQNYENKIYEETLQKYKQSNVFDKKESLQISQFINTQIQSIQQLIGHLKGENCLAALINYFKQQGQNFTQNIKEISQFVQNHKRIGKIIIKIQKDQVSKLFDNFCQKIMVLQYFNQQKQKQEQLNQINKNKQNNKTLAGRLFKKTATKDNSYSKQNNINILNTPIHQPKISQTRKCQDYYLRSLTDTKIQKYQSPTLQQPLYRPNYLLRHNY